MPSTLFRDQQRMQALFSDFERITQRGESRVRDILQPEIANIRSGIEDGNESQVDKAVDRLLTEMAANQELLYMAVSGNDEFADTIGNIHETLSNLSRVDNEKGKKLKEEMQRLSLQSIDQITKDEIKKRALLRLFFKNLEERESFDSLKRFMTKKLMEEKTSGNILNRSIDSAGSSYMGTAKRALDTSIMHAFYDPVSSISLQMLELLNFTVASSLIESFPKYAPKIAAQFGSENSGNDLSQQMMPEPGTGRMIPLRR